VAVSADRCRSWAVASLVCGMNLDLLDGLLAGVAPAAGLTARLDPVSGQCCVRIAAA